MKTHLPVALRKALLAALVAVSAFAYNRTYAFDMTVTGTRSNNELNFSGVGIVVQPDAGDPALADGNTVTSTGGSVTLKGDVAGSNNAVTANGNGNVTVEGDVAGDNNTLTVKGDGNVTVTGAISGDSNTLTVEGDGNISTGDISGDNNKLDLQGEGTLSYGSITGAGTEIKAENMVIEDLTDLSDTELNVKAINETDDVKASLTGDTINVQEDVTIGNSTEKTGELTLKDTDITAGGAVTIQQDTHMEGGSLTGSSVSVSDGSVDTPTGSVEQHYSQGATVTATTGDVSLSTSGRIWGDTGAAITSEQGAVNLDAKQNWLHNGTDITAEGDVTISNATDGSTILGVTAGGDGTDRTTVTSKTGSVNLVGGSNADRGGADVSAAGDVNITSTAQPTCHLPLYIETPSAHHLTSHPKAPANHSPNSH